MSCQEPEECQTMTPKDVIQINELKQIGPYVLTKTLGKGSYAVVKLGVHQETNEKVAVKIIRKVSTTRKLMKQGDRIRREVTILKMVRHPGVVQLLDFIETSQFYVLVMEYVPGKTLYDFLSKLIQKRGRRHRSGLSTEQVFRMFYQLVSALDYCHSIGVAHRDIKPENILLDETGEILKLTDFGLANLIQPNTLMESCCGSPYYAPPEILRGEKYKGSAADVWSLGVVLFVMVMGRLPFLDENLSNVVKLICSATYEIPWNFDLQLEDLIERMLHPACAHRISLRQLKNHPWWLRHCLLYDLDPVGTPLAVTSATRLCSTISASVLEPHMTTQFRAAIQADPAFRRRIFSDPVCPTDKSHHEDLSDSSCPDHSIGSSVPKSPFSDGPVFSGEEDHPHCAPVSSCNGRFAQRMRSMIRVLRSKLGSKDCVNEGVCRM